MNNIKLDRKTIVIGLIVLVGALYFLPKILGNDNSDDNNNNNSSGSSTTNQVDTGANFGQIVTANAVDRDGCAVGSTTTFSTSGPIYVVAQDSEVQQGTAIFVRLYYQGQPIEDLPEITADQDYNNSCINFVFGPTQGAALQSGQYEAEFVVNGNQSDSVTFQVQ